MKKFEIKKNISEAIKTNNLEKFVRNLSLLVYKKDLPDFAVDWITKYPQKAREEGKYLVVLAPRNHLKTMMFSVYYPLWKMIQNPMYEAMIFSYSVEQARHFLDILRGIIEIYFPEWMHKKYWSKSKIVLTNDSTYTVGSLTSTRYGFHPDLIILDDPLGGEGDPQKIVKSNLPPGFIEERFFSMIVPMLSPESELIVVGVPFYHGDLFTKLKERKEAYLVEEFPAIINEEKREVLWPEERPYEWLMKQRNSIGYLRFAREYLLKPYDEKSSLIPFNIIMPNLNYERDISENRIKYDSVVVVSADFAISSSLGADYSVFMAIEYINNKIYILDFERFKESDYNQQLDMLFYFINKYNPEKVVVEKNNFQKIYSQELNEKLVNVEEYFTHSEKHLFNVGIPSLRILFENKIIDIPYKSEATREKMDTLIKELQGFIMVDDKVVHIGKHDDTAMAFYLAVQGLRGIISVLNTDKVKLPRDEIRLYNNVVSEQIFWENLGG
ncbi:MAG: hypothetical protein NC901_03160 [Candidatus Omnitrophica bacterium]|nr:hypothetical protein [Candidatus Omnitrophota bacterium]